MHLLIISAGHLAGWGMPRHPYAVTGWAVAIEPAKQPVLQARHSESEEYSKGWMPRICTQFDREPASRLPLLERSPR